MSLMLLIENRFEFVVKLRTAWVARTRVCVVGAMQYFISGSNSSAMWI